MKTRLLLDTHAFVWWANGFINVAAGTIATINAADEFHMS